VPVEDEDTYPELTEPDNVVVLCDEAHRSSRDMRTAVSDDHPWRARLRHSKRTETRSIAWIHIHRRSETVDTGAAFDDSELLRFYLAEPTGKLRIPPPRRMSSSTLSELANVNFRGSGVFRSGSRNWQYQPLRRRKLM
jgi:hypothetical protein